MSDRRRLREIVATILLVIGGIGLVVASTGWWLERNLLHTSRFTGTANQILDQDEVQAELTNVLVRQLSRQAGTDLQVAEPFLASIVEQVVDSGAFRTVFDTALSNAHRVLVDRNTGTIILDLTSAYDQIKGALEQVAPNLADELPSRKQLELVLLHRSQLTHGLGRDRPSETHRRLPDRRSRRAARRRGCGRGRTAGVRSPGARGSSPRSGAVLVSSRCSSRAPCSVRASPTVCSPTRSWRHSASLPPRSSSRRWSWSRWRHSSRSPRASRQERVCRRGVRWRAMHGRESVRRSRRATSRVHRTRRAWLLGSRAESRATRILRTLVFAALGLFAVLEPSTVASVVVVLVGIALLVLAVFEGVAAWQRPRIPRGRPASASATKT